MRSGGATFYFVNDGIESALRRAREVAGSRDIGIAGGAHTIRQFLNPGLVDEFTLTVAPMFMGDGLRLFDGVDAGAVALEQVRNTDSALVTHLNYRVRHDPARSPECGPASAGQILPYDGRADS